MVKGEAAKLPAQTRRLILLGSLASEINRLELTAEDWSEVRRQVDMLFERNLLPLLGGYVEGRE